jgi:oligopeptide/dipeptide ABC transporter ATP-binding protein
MGAVASIPGSPPDLIRLPPGCTYAPRCPLAIAACSEREPDLVPVDTPRHDARCIRWTTVAEQVGSAEVAVAEKIATA